MDQKVFKKSLRQEMNKKVRENCPIANLNTMGNHLAVFYLAVIKLY